MNEEGRELPSPDNTEAAGPDTSAPAPPPRKERSTVGVRFGYMRQLGEFTAPADLKLSCGSAVVVQTDRGIELGEAVLADGCRFGQPVEPEQVERYVAASGADTYQRRSGRVLRVATSDDLAEAVHIRAGAAAKVAFCRELVARHELPMKLVECEHLLGGERIIFYFMSEGRVDFRALVRDLAHEYQTRIEMRQVGARDEARLVADYETCGQHCCCRQYLKTLKPVTMKMAKLQKATLDPSKVSGRCGRLKCCLRYEHTTYEELDHSVPRMGARVCTVEGEGVVVARQVLTQIVQIAKDDGGMATVPVEGILDPEAAAAARAEATARAEAAAAAAAERARRQESDRSGRRSQRRRPRAERPPADSTRPDAGKPPPPPRAAAAEPPAEGVDEAAPASPKKRRRRRPRRRKPRGQGGAEPGGTASQGPPGGE
jgi:cell fate regulator YaaT (PSP1 superfamily)